MTIIYLHKKGKSVKRITTPVTTFNEGDSFTYSGNDPEMCGEYTIFETHCNISIMGRAHYIERIYEAKHKD